MKLLIEVKDEMATNLKAEAKLKNLTPEELIKQILSRYFVPLHTINQDEMAEGYREMAEINLELANL